MPRNLALLSMLCLSASCTSGDKAPAGGDSAPVPGDDSSGETGSDSGRPDSDDTAPEQAPPPGASFDRFCGETAWDATLQVADVQDPGSGYLGFLDHDSFAVGTLELMKIIPPHPFYVQKVRLMFADGAGPAKIRLMTTLGRSYPGGWPELDSEGVNLMEPVEVEVDASDGRTWVEVDVSSQGIYLEPTQHYVIVNEYVDRGGPTVAVVTPPEGESERALLMLPREDLPYSIGGNFKMYLEGQEFCTWEDADRWFQERADLAFADEVSAYASVVDLDGDGHQDVVIYPDGGQLYRGDGTGAFTLADSPWPEVQYAGMLVFGDVDNDGDPDAFASNYISADADGDGWTLAEGDCDDTRTDISPGDSETTNLVDDDCDGVADDGADTSDADGDGFSVAAGDCDDADATRAPGAPETEDSQDEDCDGWVDEDFPHRMLLNDGAGQLTAVPVSGLEVYEPTTAGAFADANGDGALDLYFGNWLEHYPDDAAVQDRYYEGNGDGTFTDALAAAGLELATPWSVYGLEWNDWNNDGHPDLLVGNYHLYDNQLWENQGDGTFVDVAPEVGVDHDEEESPYSQYPGGHTYGGDFADVDNDGDMDLYMANLAHPRTWPWADPSMFVINQGAPDYTYENLREEYGLIYDEGDVNAQFADFDNDMDVDLAIASLYTQHYARVYRNDGEAGFIDVTYELGVHVEEAVTVIWLDADEDGDEDLLVADRSGAPYLHLYENRVGQDRSWTQIVVEGTRTNRDGVGARVTVEAGGVSQIREVQGGGGHWNTQKPKVLSFGLGDEEAIDRVTVRWVGGETETFSGVSPRGVWRLVEGTGVAVAR